MIFYYAQDLVRFVSASNNSKIGVTSGCFDLLHPLHVEYLNKCRKECEELYVFIDSDKLIYLNKSKTPLINELDRAYMVDNLKSVDGVIVFNTLGEMYKCINSLGVIGLKSNKTIKVFKNNLRVYGKNIIQYNYSSINQFVVPDIKRFQSTTEIVNHLNSSHE